MYDFLSDNNLLSPNQSTFRSVGSCIIQPYFNENLNAFDKGLEVRGTFFDISKAFDKVWHDGLIFKLCQKCYKSRYHQHFKKFFSQQKTKSSLEWSVFILGLC